MNIQDIIALIFFALLILYIFINRKKMEFVKFLFPLFYLVKYKTKKGLGLMQNIAKRFPKSLRFIGYLGIVIGFIGMIYTSWELIRITYMIFAKPAAIPVGGGVVLPFKAKGVFYVPFFYWIISIVIIASVHELSHGIMAMAHKIKIQYSGAGFGGLLFILIPFAFVQPDEKQLLKKKNKEKLSVFAAGPFANIALGLIFLAVLIWVAAPITNAMMELSGIKVTGFVEGKEKYPAEIVGIAKGEVIREISNTPVRSLDTFSGILQNKSPGDKIFVLTDKGSYNITLAKNPENESKAYLGIYLQQDEKIKESVKERFGPYIPSFIIWLVGLVFILFFLNLAIGLFNLIPIFVTDGALMVRTALEKFFPKEKAFNIWKAVNIFFLFLLFINLAFGFIR